MTCKTMLETRFKAIQQGLISSPDSNTEMYQYMRIKGI